MVVYPLLAPVALTEAGQSTRRNTRRLSQVHHLLSWVVFVVAIAIPIVVNLQRRYEPLWDGGTMGVSNNPTIVIAFLPTYLILGLGLVGCWLLSTGAPVQRLMVLDDMSVVRGGTQVAQSCLSSLLLKRSSSAAEGDGRSHVVMMPAATPNAPNGEEEGPSTPEQQQQQQQDESTLLRSNFELQASLLPLCGKLYQCVLLLVIAQVILLALRLSRSYDCTRTSPSTLAAVLDCWKSLSDDLSWEKVLIPLYVILAAVLVEQLVVMPTILERYLVIPEGGKADNNSVQEEGRESPSTSGATTWASALRLGSMFVGLCDVAGVVVFLIFSIPLYNDVADSTGIRTSSSSDRSDWVLRMIPLIVSSGIDVLFAVVVKVIWTWVLLREVRLDAAEADDEADRSRAVVVEEVREQLAAVRREGASDIVIVICVFAFLFLLHRYGMGESIAASVPVYVLIAVWGFDALLGLICFRNPK